MGRLGRDWLHGLRTAQDAAVLVHGLELGGLALLALGAMRQSYRVRRAFAEATPPISTPLPAPAPSVSIILPLRDEATNVDGVLAALLAQDYPTFDVTVIDDGSTDATPQLLAAWVRRDPRLRVQRIADLPAGWAGKAHALHTGVAITNGDWLLFTDADTRHAPHTLRLMMGHALRQGDDLLSLLPDLSLVGPGTRLLTPIGALTLIERATPAEVRDPAHPYALAIGQYILVRRAVYQTTGGYAAPELRATFADDVALAEHLKRRGGRIDLVDGHGLVTNEQWTTWASAWRGWRKSAYSEVARRPVFSLVGSLFLLAYGLVPSAVLVGSVRAVACGHGRHRVHSARHSSMPRWLPTLLAATTVVAQIDARTCLDRAYHLPLRWSLTAPLGWSALGILLLETTWRVVTGRGADWKGRSAPRPNGTSSATSMISTLVSMDT